MNKTKFVLSAIAVEILQFKYIDNSTGQRRTLANHKTIVFLKEEHLETVSSELNDTVICLETGKLYYVGKVGVSSLCINYIGVLDEPSKLKLRTVIGTLAAAEDYLQHRVLEDRYEQCMKSGISITDFCGISAYAHLTPLNKSNEIEQGIVSTGHLSATYICKEFPYFLLSEETLADLKLQVVHPEMLHCMGGPVKVYGDLGGLVAAELNKPFISFTASRDTYRVNVALSDEEISMLKREMGDRVVVYQLGEGSFVSSPDWVLDEESQIRLKDYLSQPNVKAI